MFSNISPDLFSFLHELLGFKSYAHQLLVQQKQKAGVLHLDSGFQAEIQWYEMLRHVLECWHFWSGARYRSLLSGILKDISQFGLL